MLDARNELTVIYEGIMIGLGSAILYELNIDATGA